MMGRPPFGGPYGQVFDPCRRLIAGLRTPGAIAHLRGQIADRYKVVIWVDEEIDANPKRQR